MVLQGIQPRLHDIVYEMASTVERIPLRGVEGLRDVVPPISDNSREVHMQIEQMALLHGQPSNDCTYTKIQQSANIVTRGEIRPTTEACREYTHLDDQLSHLAPDRVPAPDTATPSGGRGSLPCVGVEILCKLVPSVSSPPIQTSHWSAEQ